MYTIWQPVDGKDFMSYCYPRWTSDYTYVGLLADQLKHGAAAANAEEAGAAPGVPVLWLRATLRTGPDNGVTAEFLPLYTLIGAPDVAPAEAACRIRLLGEAGQLLAEVAVEPMEAMDAGPLRYVSALVPAPAQAVVGLTLACDGQPVASVDLPAPAATAAGVAAPHVRLEGQSVILEWGPAEAPALVQMQAAGGDAWMTLGVDVVGGVLTLDAEALPGGSVTFRVVTAGAGAAALQAAAVSDGLHSGEIQLPDGAPRVWITGPSSGPEGASVVLFGHAFDAEDGVLEDLQWFVDGAPAGTGDVLQRPVPAAGSVEVSLSAVDSAGHTVIARHRLEASAAN